MAQARRSQGETGRAALRAALLAWYDRHRRDLPWRRSSDPYRIWVSEVMLQQTTVKTVLPYYAAFLNRFPTLQSLAEEPEEEVLAAWSGLGYYHRARNLHRGAQHVAERHGGQFPRSLEAALGVPGVGLYTASAVLSIAHGMPLPVVDGNVRRVLARLLALRGPQFRKDGPYYNRAEELIDPERPGDWNQALMELGATVCLPRKPACPACPLRQRCEARALGIVEALPEGRPRRASVDVTVAAALVERDGRVLLVRRPQGRLLDRLWEVPQTSLDSQGRPDLARELEERHGLRVVPGPLAVRARHAVTHRRITLEGYRTRLRPPLPEDPERFLWARPEEVARLAVASSTRKLLKGLRAPQLPLEL
ncbi:MAG TPA: A/G-specific adenine glycosylase [Vicinamibacteria bacterium]|nr:A/G-specific adenine glycosylase [Vicinamibacteria bacterium]